MVGDWGTNGSATTETGGDAPGRHGRAVAVAVTLVLLSLAVILDQRAPAAMGPDAQATTFSSLRAMDHLEQIAAEPHAVTQVGHARSRDYIVAQLRSLGWQTHVQAGTVDGEPTVYNVVGRLAGTDSTGAIMIAGHYDSVSAGPGAADDGLAVASMVEVARALAEGPRLRNDVILNFTDGEEAGLLGARVFVREHPWRDDVGLVLNFEGGGPRGPLVMIETSHADVDLVRTYANAAPAPVSTSLMPTVIEAAKEGGIGSSDFVPFRELDEPGMNFSNGLDTGYRHTPGDVVARIDADTLQHQGGTMLALTREFGERDLDAVGSTDADVVWVTLFTFLVPIWSTPGAAVLLVLALAAFTLAVVGARRLGKGSVRGIVRGATTTLLAVPVAVVAVSVVVGVMQWIRPSFKPHFAGFSPRQQLPGAGLPGSGILWWALMLVAAGTTVLVFARARRRWGAIDVAIGANAVALLLAVLTTLTLPGLSYLFAPVALFGAAALAGWTLWLRGGLDDWRTAALLLAGAVPTLLIGIGLANSFQLVTVANAAVIAPFVALFAAQLIPCMEVLGAADRRLPAGGVVGSAVVLLALGLVVVRADPVTAGGRPYAGPWATEVTATRDIPELATQGWQVEAVELNGERICLRATTASIEAAHWCPLPPTAAIDLDLQQARGDGGTLLFGGVSDPLALVQLTVDGRGLEVAPAVVDGIDGAVFSILLPEGTRHVDEVVAIGPNGSVLATWTGFDVPSGSEGGEEEDR